jgi:hypothetical protein
MDMRKNLKWLIAVIAAGLLIVAIAIPVLAAGPNGTGGSGLTGYAIGGCQGSGAGIDEAVVALLGMSREEIQAERQGGKSLVQIAYGKGVSEETLITTILAEKQEALKELVAAGTITQELAEQRLVQMRERVQLAVNRTTVGPPEWAGKGQGGQRGNQQNCTGIQGTCVGQGSMMRGGRASR